MSFKTQADVQREHASAEYQRQVDTGLAAIYSKYKNYKPCQANDKIIVEWCNQFMGAEVAPNVVLFEAVLEENPELKVALQNVVEQREDLIEEIIALLKSAGTKIVATPSGDREYAYILNDQGGYNAYALIQERANLSNSNQWTRDALTVRRDDLRARIERMKTLGKMDTTQLRQVATTRPQQSTRKALPAEYTKERITKQISVHELKHIVRTFGVAAVNDRIFGRG